MPQWMSKKLQPYGASIFDVIGREVRSRPHVVNLGQGFPDFDGPELIKEAAFKAMRDGHNQYAPLSGVGELTSVVQEIMAERTGITFDPAREMTVLCGATEAMYATLTALCEPGDEWIVFAPIYDTYVPTIEMCGGRCIQVELEPPSWRFDPDKLRAAFSDKTRGIIVNTPHNPTGTVLNMKELELIRDLCVRHDAIAVVDEVYEYLTYDDVTHISLVGLEGMRERTITISSTGKSFSLTGWKVGWAIAPPEATLAIRRLHQFVAFAIATPLQYAMAAGLRARSSLVGELHAHLKKQRDIICSGLTDVGFRVTPPQGTYFVLADFSSFSNKPDTEYVLELITSQVGVAAIPVSVFYMDPSKAPTNYIRFCFAKRDETLQAGLTRLAQLRS